MRALRALRAKKMKNPKNVIFQKIAKSVPVVCTKNRETTSIAYTDIQLKYYSCTISATMRNPIRTLSFKSIDFNVPIKLWVLIL